MREYLEKFDLVTDELTDEKQRIILSLIRDAVQELETCNEDKAAAGVRLLRQFDEFPNSYGVREIYLFLLRMVKQLLNLNMLQNGKIFLQVRKICTTKKTSYLLVFLLFCIIYNSCFSNNINFNLAWIIHFIFNSLRYISCK